MNDWKRIFWPILVVAVILLALYLLLGRELASERAKRVEAEKSSELYYEWGKKNLQGQSYLYKKLLRLSGLVTTGSVNEATKMLDSIWSTPMFEFPDSLLIVPPKDSSEVTDSS